MHAASLMLLVSLQVAGRPGCFLSARHSHPAGCPPLCSCLQLTSLAVNDNNLGGSALTALAPLTKLRRLDVAGASGMGCMCPTGWLCSVGLDFGRAGYGVCLSGCSAANSFRAGRQGSCDPWPHAA